MGYLPYQLVQDFNHQQYDSPAVNHSPDLKKKHHHFSTFKAVRAIPRPLEVKLPGSLGRIKGEAMKTMGIFWGRIFSRKPKNLCFWSLNVYKLDMRIVVLIWGPDSLKMSFFWEETVKVKMEYWNCTVLRNHDFLLDPAPCKMISICFKMGFLMGIHVPKPPHGRWTLGTGGENPRFLGLKAPLRVTLGQSICFMFGGFEQTYLYQMVVFLYDESHGIRLRKNILKWTIIEIRVFKPTASFNIRMITYLKANSFQSFESPILKHLSYIMAHHFSVSYISCIMVFASN